MAQSKESACNAGDHNWKRHMCPSVLCSIFTIARTWKQPRCPSTDEWIQKLWYICTMEYYSAIKKKEGIGVSPNKVDEPRAYGTEWSKSERKTQILYINACVWNLERWCWCRPFLVFVELVTTLLLFHVLVFWPWDMWDLGFLTKDRTHTLCIGRQSLNH